VVRVLCRDCAIDTTEAKTRLFHQAVQEFKDVAARIAVV